MPIVGMVVVVGVGMGACVVGVRVCCMCTVELVKCRNSIIVRTLSCNFNSPMNSLGRA